MRRFSSVVVILLCTLLQLSTQAEELPLQKWIDEAIKAGGGVVTIPEGTHELPAGLVLSDAKKLALRGTDKERCILKLVESDSGGAFLINITGLCETVEIANLTLVGSGSSISHGIRVQGSAGKSKDIVIRDCLFTDISGTAAAFANCEAGHVERCSFRDGRGTAIAFQSGAVKGLALGNRIARFKTAFALEDSSGCLLEGNEIFDCPTGLRVSYKASNLTANTVRNNAFNNAAYVFATDAPQLTKLEHNEDLPLTVEK